MIDRLKQVHRGLLELSLGILFWGIICLMIGCFFAKDPVLYGAALLLGVFLAWITAYHMYKTLDKALDLGADASKVVTTANLIRYVSIVIVFAIVWLTGILNPLFTFLGLMTLKAGAYSQPLTHKVCNKIFHEVDPIPMPLEEDAEISADTSSEKQGIENNK